MKIIARIRDLLYSIINYTFLIVFCAVLGFLVWHSYHNLMNLSIHAQTEETEWNHSDAIKDTSLSMNVTIPSGLNAEQLCDLLEKYAILKHEEKQAFLTYAKTHLKSGTVKAGTYSLTNTMSPEEIFQQLHIEKK